MSAAVLRYRFTPRQLLFSVLAPVVLLGVFALITTAGMRAALIGASIGSLVVGVLRLRAGLDLQPEGAVVRGLVGRVVVPWSEIRTIEVGQQGARRIVVIETEARLYRPIAPATSKGMPDPDFEAKARAIADYWRTHR